MCLLLRIHRAIKGSILLAWSRSRSLPLRTSPVASNFSFYKFTSFFSFCSLSFTFPWSFSKFKWLVAGTVNQTVTCDLMTCVSLLSWASWSTGRETSGISPSDLLFFCRVLGFCSLFKSLCLWWGRLTYFVPKLLVHFYLKQSLIVLRRPCMCGSQNVQTQLHVLSTQFVPFLASLAYNQ